MSRRSPRRHDVDAHIRDGGYVGPYVRGKDYPLRSRERIVVGEVDEEDDAPRIITINGVGVQIFVDELSTEANKGLVLWIEIQKLESQLDDRRLVNYNRVGWVVSKAFDHLRRKRSEWRKYDIDQEYRNARRAISRKNIEGVLIATSAFQTELALCYQDSWRVVE